MTIIVFLIDTSASMNQRGYLGGRPTLLDVAKGAVETFVKVGGQLIWRSFKFALVIWSCPIRFLGNLTKVTRFTVLLYKFLS